MAGSSLHRIHVRFLHRLWSFCLGIARGRSATHCILRHLMRHRSIQWWESQKEMDPAHARAGVLRQSRSGRFAEQEEVFHQHLGGGWLDRMMEEPLGTTKRRRQQWIDDVLRETRLHQEPWKKSAASGRPRTSLLALANRQQFEVRWQRRLELAVEAQSLVF